VVDTHAHLGLCKPGESELVEAAHAAGVNRILTVGLDEGTNREAVAHAEAHEAVFASVGRHPNSAAGFDDEAAAAIAELAREPGVRAIGETGIDLYREGAPLEDQRRAFEAQIGIAAEVKKPVVIHVRDAEDSTEASEECLATLAEKAGGDVILHCFSLAPEKVAVAAERGWYCSFAGNVTYPKASELRKAAGLVPEELLLLETDSPYLAPQPVRGKPNQPANVVATAEVVARERRVALEALDAMVEANAARVFGW
jgi:TatD DNase family protein